METENSTNRPPSNTEDFGTWRNPYRKYSRGRVLASIGVLMVLCGTVLLGGVREVPRVSLLVELGVLVGFWYVGMFLIGRASWCGKSKIHDRWQEISRWWRKFCFWGQTQVARYLKKFILLLGCLFIFTFSGAGTKVRSMVETWQRNGS